MAAPAGLLLQGCGCCSCRRNPKALVNKGCTLSLQGDEEKAVELFKEAAAIDPHCQEALYNLIVTWRKLRRYTRNIKPWTVNAKA